MDVQPSQYCKYYIYARKSTDEDTRQIRSIQDQIIELKAHAQKEKLNVVDIFIEKKSSSIIRQIKPIFKIFKY